MQQDQVEPRLLRAGTATCQPLAEIRRELLRAYSSDFLLAIQSTVFCFSLGLLQLLRQLQQQGLTLAARWHSMLVMRTEVEASSHGLECHLVVDVRLLASCRVVASGR